MVPATLVLVPTIANLPRLAPSPVRTGEFQEFQLAPLELARRTPLAMAGFGEVQQARSGSVTGADPVYQASAGSFGNAAAPPLAGPVPLSKVVASGFNAATIAEPGILPTRADQVPARSYVPAEIQFKPRPEYTEEARRQHIEGEVLVEMLLTAAGEVKLMRMVRGLGYGLDQTAQAAARQIRFRPAQRAGVPVDSLAVVHIEFQLAY
jgi:TonB family protein